MMERVLDGRDRKATIQDLVKGHNMTFLSHKVEELNVIMLVVFKWILQ